MKAYENKIKKLTEELEAIKEANKTEAEETSHSQDVKNIPFSLFASNIDNKTQRRMTWGGSSNIDSSETACKISHDWLKYIEILAMEEIKNNLLSKGQDTFFCMNPFPDVKSSLVPKTLIHASTQTNVYETDVLLENVVFPNAVSSNSTDDKVINIVPFSSCHATLGAYDDISNVSLLYEDQVKSEFYLQNQKKMLTFIESKIKQNKTLKIIQCENIIKYVQKVLQLFSTKQNYDKNAILETDSFHKEFWFFIIFLKSLFPELLNNSISFFHEYIPEFLENNIPELLLNNFSVSRIDILKELKYLNSNFYFRKILDKKFAKANQSKIQDKLERIISHSCDDDLKISDSFTNLSLMSSTNNQAISTVVNSFDLNKCLGIEDLFECQSCVTNDEVMKKLQEQIQLQQDTISHLMYQCDIKNKQISILKEKEQIKDQIILSLQNEIALRNDKNKEICKLNLNETVTDELKENFFHTDKLNINDGAILQPIVKKESCSLLHQCCRCEHNYFVCKMKCCVENNHSKTKFDAVELKLDKMYTVNNASQNIIVPKRDFSSVCDPVLIRTPETNDIILKDIQNEICSPSKRCIAKKFVSDAISSQEENLPFQTADFDFPKINKHFRKLIIVNNDDDSNDVISLRNEMSHLRKMFFRLIEKNTQNAVFMNKENSGLGHAKNISFYNDNISDFTVLQEVFLRVDCFLKNLQKSASVNKGLKQAAEEVISLKIELLDLQKKLQEKDTLLFSANKKLLDLKRSIILLKYTCQSSKSGKSKILNRGKYAKDISLKARHLNPVRTIDRLHKMVSELFSFFEKQVLSLSIISTELEETEARLLCSLKDLTLDTILNEESFSDSTSSSINDKKVLEVDTVGLVSSKDSETEKRNLASMISNIKSNIVKVSKASSHIGKLFECIKSSYRNKIESLELMHEDDKLKWNTKIMEKIEELEEKYEQEITDQENELFGIMNTKLNNMKQKFALAEKEKEQQFKEQMDKIQKEYSEQILALKEEHCKNISDLEKKLYKEVEDKKEMQDKLHKIQKSEIMVLKLSNKLKDFKKEEENIKKLNNYFKQKIKLQLVEIEKLKTQLNECHKKYFSHDANSLSSSENENNSKGQFNKLQTSEPEGIQPAVSTGNLCFETDNLTKKLKYELDQKRAKIMSLETNNASMVKEIMMLKNRMKNMQQHQCGCSQNLKGLEIPVPPKEGYYAEKEKHGTGMNKKFDKQKEVPLPAELRHFSSGDNNQCKKQKTECDAKTKQSVAKEAEVVLDEMGELQCKQQ
ncbi:uncharacterized protein PFB0145c-like isoform X2 [Stegodyphus dumicola]|uniref:uncharacterized protein PFB0145c-like isoform X2 n=1 Tax=Stegodyphus dumicola TaxID=202533 RepID=UPI0015AF1B71|nr:uncharacterized protein PFB0145c-like isoform X2 [Stegodyphus dumicola]